MNFNAMRVPLREPERRGESVRAASHLTQIYDGIISTARPSAALDGGFVRQNRDYLIFRVRILASFKSPMISVERIFKGQPAINVSIFDRCLSHPHGRVLYAAGIAYAVSLKSVELLSS